MTYRSIERNLVDSLHRELINRDGGSHGILNSGGIDSALRSPFASFGGQDLYPTDLEKCCKLFHALITNHGYIDGNKRIGLCMFLISMDICGYDYTKFSVDFLVNLSLKIANGEMSVNQLCDVVRDKQLK